MVTAGHTAGFVTHATCRLTAKNRNPTLGNRVWATFTFTQSRKLLSAPPLHDVIRSVSSRV